jgi:hypothetical protein
MNSRFEPGDASATKAASSPRPGLNNQLLTMKNFRGKIRVVAMGAGYFFLTNRRAVARDDGWVNQGSN